MQEQSLTISHPASLWVVAALEKLHTDTPYSSIPFPTGIGETERAL